MEGIGDRHLALMGLTNDFIGSLYRLSWSQPSEREEWEGEVQERYEKLCAFLKETYERKGEYHGKRC